MQLPEHDLLQPELCAAFDRLSYGNVWSGARLDYTVIGRDVSLAARIANLCRNLNQTLLLSNAFQQRLSEHELRNMGAFKLKGFDRDQTVFAPVGIQSDPILTA